MKNFDRASVYIHAYSVLASIFAIGAILFSLVCSLINWTPINVALIVWSVMIVVIAQCIIWLLDYLD